MRLMLGVFSFCFAVASWAQQATISLNDGSVLRGDVVGLSNGFYSLRGNSFGELKIPKNNVRSIEYGDTSASPAGPGLSQLQAIEARLLMDPNLLDSIQSLANDPLVRDIVNDPEIHCPLQVILVATAAHHFLTQTETFQIPSQGTTNESHTNDTEFADHRSTSPKA